MSARPPCGSRNSPASGSHASAFIVKSRRSRSASRSVWKVTDSGRRPSTYAPSPRNVVTSMARPPVITVTVPCSIPVGTTLRKSAVTSCGLAGVAMSKSDASRGRCRRRSRTAPPTIHER